MSRRSSTAAALSLFLSTCSPPQQGRPVRLVHSTSDTVVLNSRHPSPLAVRALDAMGAPIVNAPIRYAWTGGDSLPVTPTGEVTCIRSGDFTVRALLGGLVKRLKVQSRVVEYVRIPGPLQFVLGDSGLSRPLSLPLSAYDTNGRPIIRYGASVGVKDTGIATVRGLTLFPRKRGITALGAHIGDREAGIGVHVYQRVSSLGAVDTILRVRPDQRLFAAPLQLRTGELIRQRLPPGDWMLAMLPETDSAPDRLQLRIEGAHCQEHFLNSPRRWGCHAGPDAAMIIYRPFGRPQAPAAVGYLLVRWLFS